ncbi:MAG: type II secretion system protein [Patescibacteria group bacterium]
MKKGFTLLELLIVIGILAILATAATIVLNPAELLRQARDTQRIADLDAVKAAISLYLTDVTSPALGTTTNCYVNPAGVAANCATRHAGKTTTIIAGRAVDGTGWVPVNLGSISTGAPLAVYPVDPTNSATVFYSYSNTATTIELNADLEAAKYIQGGANDKESTDGGTMAGIYEVGTEPGLDI